MRYLEKCVTAGEVGWVQVETSRTGCLCVWPWRGYRGAEERGGGAGEEGHRLPQTCHG